MYNFFIGLVVKMRDIVYSEKLATFNDHIDKGIINSILPLSLFGFYFLSLEIAYVILIISFKS